MTISIHFRLHGNPKKRKENLPCFIKCYVSVNSERERQFSIGYKTLPSRFKNEQISAKDLTDGEKAINQLLTKTKAELTEFFIEKKLLEEEFSTQQFLTLFNARHLPAPPFMQIWEEYLKEAFESEDKNLEESTKNKYRRAKDFFLSFLLDIKMEKLYAYNINKQLVWSYYESLQLRSNQFGKPIDKIHAYRLTKHIYYVLEFARLKSYIKYHDWEKFGIVYPKAKEIKKITLKNEQLSDIYHLQHLSEIQRKIADAFIVMAYTGLTYADYCRFAADPKKFIVQDEETEDLYISINRFKNRKQRDETVPYIYLFRIVREILERYDFRLPIYANQIMNKQIQLICYQAGIPNWKEITTYVARKSIATNLAKQPGVEIKTISKLLGHSRVSTTQRYYVDLPKELVVQQIGRRFD